jgi:hypothetical protein
VCFVVCQVFANPNYNSAFNYANCIKSPEFKYTTERERGRETEKGEFFSCFR